MNTPMNLFNKFKDYVGNVAEDIVEATGFSEQGNGLLVPRDHYPLHEFTDYADKEVVENMAGYYSRATLDGVVAVKTLVDSDNNLLCAVVSKGIGGTSYYYERDEQGKPEADCSPMTIIDLAMKLVQLQRDHKIISWGALTADFRLLHSRGYAQDEFALLAANHVDMLYQLRMDCGTKLNLQLACISMGITAVEKEARSFKIEEAIKDWKTGSTSRRNEIMDSMRAYCKLLMALYGSVAERGEFVFKPKDSVRLGIENAPATIKMQWNRVWEVHRDKWEKGDISRQGNTSEAYVSVNVMHNWLVEHAARDKKTLQQLTTPASGLSDLMGRT